MLRQTLLLLALNIWTGQVLNRTMRQGLPRFSLILLVPGTILHELSHFVLAVISGKKITGVSLVNLTHNPDKTISVSGHVQYMSKTTVLGHITSSLVSLAPMLFGLPLVFLILDKILKPHTGLFESVILVISFLLISTAWIPSLEDVKTSIIGLVILGVGGLVSYIVFNNFFLYTIENFSSSIAIHLKMSLAWNVILTFFTKAASFLLRRKYVRSMH